MTPMRSGFSTDSEAVTDSVWRCDRCGPGGLSLMSGNSRLAGLKPTHPGELLREDVFPALGIPKTQIAKRLGISRAMLYAILEERAPITPAMARSEEHTSELQSLMRISYAVFCMQQKNIHHRANMTSDY